MFSWAWLSQISVITPLFFLVLYSLSSTSIGYHKRGNIELSHPERMWGNDFWVNMDAEFDTMDSSLYRLHKLFLYEGGQVNWVFSLLLGFGIALLTLSWVKRLNIRNLLVCTVFAFMIIDTASRFDQAHTNQAQNQEVGYHMMNIHRHLTTLRAELE